MENAGAAMDGYSGKTTADHPRRFREFLSQLAGN
ncbi:hypothetical protein C497_11737 [Halalkalicoccus jeotgali B3]|uniref:Uncharacterized protein n=1 Tax=Halalkalicoccus jeotgali (strain DSM 18796 / CECT 7217 / JCM 14584 / KCTC 4019 / B3) TaxID=795797 RepID=D8J4V3_HALJB|nr:hypothetical protein HacjB3_10935 [Halalkalicoccus jeotgali B3]ELY36022.1 hypothetical protein C497_11737 [Halalkalicoccus jeotgali B3]